MSKPLQWVLGICAVLIVLSIVASNILPFFAPQLGLNNYGYGMMGPGHMAGGGHMFGGRSMMGSFGGMSFFGFGMLLWPILWLALIALGIVWLVRTVSAPRAPAVPQAACAHCGKPIQPGWKACSHCGEKI
ncbi:MAG: zinc ribbon domain-containing protein [Chloroflexi bacterium]|nr:zinc ribbon domain-containing protein [Chloroflexota bacterium]